ncbi:MAG: hypothetical protein AAFO75_02410, partial [Pseudomonadota bacterium]
AIALMALGGLTTAIVDHQIRWLGVVMIGAGLTIAASPDRPHILISKSAQTIAVRGDDGRLRFAARQKNSYVEERWLERDGDDRKSAALRRDQGFQCDAYGCVTRVGEQTVAITRRPRGLQDDCALADLVIVVFANAPECLEHLMQPGHQPHRIDRADLEQLGALAIYLKPMQGGIISSDRQTIGGKASRGAANQASGPARSSTQDQSGTPIAQQNKRWSTRLQSVNHEWLDRIETVNHGRANRPWGISP